jgi:hypothetical protein
MLQDEQLAIFATAMVAMTHVVNGLNPLPSFHLHSLVSSPPLLRLLKLTQIPLTHKLNYGSCFLFIIVDHNVYIMHLVSVSPILPGALIMHWLCVH